MREEIFETDAGRHISDFIRQDPKFCKKNISVPFLIFENETAFFCDGCLLKILYSKDEIIICFHLLLLFG